jgi:hypothetical protein
VAAVNKVLSVCLRKSMNGNSHHLIANAKDDLGTFNAVKRASGFEPSRRVRPLENSGRLDEGSNQENDCRSESWLHHLRSDRSKEKL